ncbi:MAG: M56 family metallopeptidase, partial [Acidobacteria bacterium]|nr:M56 family metallopeptidase [Acidobacteriota bacterium]
MTGLLVDLGPRLAWASAGAGVLALLAWVVGAALPRTPAAMRALLWWLAALRLLAGLIPLPAVALPVLPAPAAGATAGVADVPGPPVAAHVARAPVPARAAPRELGRMAAIGAGLLWLAGTLVSFARMTGNWRSVRRILADAAPVLDPVALGGVGTLARRAGLRHPPRLLSSGEVATPFAAGLLRPAIVLPGRCAANTSASRLALAHEISHVRGHDLLWAWVPALSRCVLWFHPLAHLAEREFARAREEAADAAALRLTGAARDEYARVLLSFGIARGPSPALAAPGASRHFRQLKRRIEMLQNIRHMSRRQLAGWAVAVVLLAAAVFVPVRLVAAQSDAPKPMPSRDALPAAPPAPPAIPAP